MPAGRPSIYSTELADAICDRLMVGESLRSICEDDGFPGITTVIRWLADENHEFGPKYARAREVQADYLADQMMDVANDARNDWMEAHGQDGESAGYKFNGEAVQRSKLRLEQMRWNAEKLRPKKYGSKLAVEHSGTVSIAERLQAKREQRNGQ